MTDTTTSIEDDAAETVATLKSFASAVSGWEYNESIPIHRNVSVLGDLLIDQVKADAARIQRLHLKLGQAAEKL